MATVTGNSSTVLGGGSPKSRAILHRDKDELIQHCAFQALLLAGGSLVSGLRGVGYDRAGGVYTAVAEDSKQELLELPGNSGYA